MYNKRGGSVCPDKEDCPLWCCIAGEADRDLPQSVARLGVSLAYARRGYFLQKQEKRTSVHLLHNAIAKVRNIQGVACADGEVENQSNFSGFF